jgi:ATP-dependent helicase HrpA
VGGLWSDEGAYDFLVKRLPVEVATTKDFHRWRLKEGNEEQLMISLRDVVWEEIWDELALFPDEVWHQEKPHRVVYHSEPGAADDGLCFEVPIDVLSVFPDYLPGWGVPGIFAERVELLMRSLPKDQRTACFPIADAVEGFLAEWEGWEPNKDLLAALAEFLSARSGHLIEAEMFDPLRLPDELRPKLRVVGEDGKVYGIGEDVQAAKDQLAGVLRQRREESANLEWETTGGTYWSFGELPVEAEGAYPALVDEGEAVGTRAFLDPREATESHRAGCVRLFLLDQAEQAEFVRKRFPLGPGVKLSLGLLGGPQLKEDLLRVAGEGAMGVLPRDRDTFERAAAEGKGRLYECAQTIAGELEVVTEIQSELRQWLDEHRADRHLSEVVEDLEEQLLWLLGPGFAWRAGYGRMKRYGRYLHGIRERLERLESRPLIRDEEKRDQFRPLWERWIVTWQQSPEAARWWEAGWMLEEWRLQLFAPGQGRETKVSAKRIESLLESL